MTQTTEKLTVYKDWVAEMYSIGVPSFAAEDKRLRKEEREQLKDGT